MAKCISDTVTSYQSPVTSEKRAEGAEKAGEAGEEIYSLLPIARVPIAS